MEPKYHIDGTEEFGYITINRFLYSFYMYMNTVKRLTSLYNYANVQFLKGYVAHPFMEGNGRSTRIWLDLIFKARLKLCVDWSKIDKKAYLSAMKQSTTDARAIKSLLQGAMTDRIDDREIFMKGIDYSYYYEQTD